MQTITIKGITYEVLAARATPIKGREMLTLRRPGGTVRYIAFRDSNGHLSNVTKHPEV